ARERLERGLMTGVEYLSEHEGVIRAMIEPSFQLQEPVHRRLLEQNRRIVEAAEHCIRAGLAAGELRSVDPSLAALIFASLLGALITGRIFHSESTGGADSISFDHPAALAQAALDLLYEGLRIR